MEEIKLLLCSNYNGDMEISLFSDLKSDYYDIPSGKELVYNDNEYTFRITNSLKIPSKICINDDVYKTEKEGNNNEFKLIDCNKPFFQSFGAVRIELIIDDVHYVSKSIAVMVSNTIHYTNVNNMIEYIYKNCEKYLYEEKKRFSDDLIPKKSEVVSLETKMDILEKIITTYREESILLKRKPYSKIEKIQKIDSFDKLHSFSQTTIRYITEHSDELIPVNYNTGIKYNGQYYQPKKTSVEYNSYTFDIYENRMIVNFLYTIIDDISKIIKDIQTKILMGNKKINRNGYIDSVHYIFSKSISKISEYSKKLVEYKETFKQIYYYYQKLFSINGEKINQIPRLTPIFRSSKSYRQIYQVMYIWFNCGEFDLGKNELMLGFISTSKIYEYYCLLKILSYFDNMPEFNFDSSERMLYGNVGKFYENTKCNNTFMFSYDNIKMTLYFQPVVYGNNSGINGIRLFRNTSIIINSSKLSEGIPIYTPDYILKIDDGCNTRYLIIDAKFSIPRNVRSYQLSNIVFKYLFSITPLDEKDSVMGVYLLCGKTFTNDETECVHDIANKIGRKIYPFVEIMPMNGENVDDVQALSYIKNKLLS